ncbi:hypothetical protein [Gemmobacter sp.]|uniref:hypothetical protein n=1 Tax=Gemmobacter sp. TaxID=1898957 RepID=UPI002AFE0088|nr:hypothetical protein [Gemmobacter sp.]
MALTFPLSTTQFMDLLPIKEMTFELSEAMETDETGGGEILTADLGARLWQGEIVLGDMTPDEADTALALIDLLRRAGGSFMVHDRARPWPRSDWKGAALATFSPTIYALNAAPRELRIAGLPVGYVLRPRDALAFSYGSNPTRFALHRLVGSVTANASGIVPQTEVVPNIRPGATVGAAVQLIKPACKAVIVPGSYQPGRRKARLTTGASFRWQQTLR